MDYSKSGNPKGAKGAPRFDAHSKHCTGAPKPQKPDPKEDKAAILARLKAAAKK